jgi:hypothetical protein
MRASSIAVLLLIPFATACVSDRFQNLPSTNGQALAVKPVVEQVPITRETQHYGENGQPIGASVTVVGYEPKTTGFTLALGEQTIDERDYYHLAQDRSAEDAIASGRRTGKIMMGTGAAIVLAGLISTIALSSTDSPAYVKAMPVEGGLIVGALVYAIGGMKVKKRYHSASRAFRALEAEPPTWAVNLGD